MAGNIYKQNGSKYYYLRVTVDGVERRESLRTANKRIAKGRAKSRLEEMRGLADRGELSRTFSNGLVEWYDYIATTDWAATTKKRYMTSTRQIGRVMMAIGEDDGFDVEDLQAADVDVSLVGEYVARRLAAKATVATVNRDLTAFGGMMRFMKNKAWIDANPVDAYEKIGMAEKLPYVSLPTDSAIRLLAERAPGTLSYFPEFLNATGGRVTEAALLKWSDILDLNSVSHKASITFRKAKGGKVRTVEATPQAVKILQQIPRSNRSPYVFWNEEEHGYYKSIANLFYEYREDIEFGSRLHDIRHKFAVERLREGWSIYRVCGYLGHGSVLTTERYYLRHLTQEQQEHIRMDGFNGM